MTPRNPAPSMRLPAIVPLSSIRRVPYPTPPLRARGRLDQYATCIVAVYVARAARWTSPHFSAGIDGDAT